MPFYLNQIAFRQVFFVPLIIETVFVISCGGDGTDDTAAPAQPAATTAAAPVATAAPAPQATAEPGQPQATSAPAPQATEPPLAAVTEVHPGKVTVLNTVWGPELFTNWAWGEVMGYNRQIHSYWMIGSENVEILPGAATSWEVAPDGLSWIFTIRDGITFHNGHEFNIDDAVFTMNATYGTITTDDGTVWEAKEQGGQNVLTVARAT